MKLYFYTDKYSKDDMYNFVFYLVKDNELYYLKDGNTPLVSRSVYSRQLRDQGFDFCEQVNLSENFKYYTRVL